MLEPFIQHGSEALLSTPIFRLRKDRAEHPRTGHVGDYYVLENPDWVNIVALTDQREILLVRQWRHGSARIELELPAGMVEVGEAPAAAGARELLEETGYAAERWTMLGQVSPNAAYQSNTCFTLLAEGCRRAGEVSFDPGEDIELVTVSQGELRDLVRRGEFRNALVLVGLLWWLESAGAIGWPGAGG
jgi:8-oxo-dGTP pyrophosphatase MutT (NUDIX family)